MRITSDWHIHSRNSCDQACMTVPDLIREAAARGIQDYGLTDHVHTACNLPELAASRREFLDSGPPPQFHFGVEVSCMSQWELDAIATGAHGAPTYGLRRGGPPGCALALGATAEDLAEHGVEYVVGGTHWPMYVPFERDQVIRDYHRQNMFLATHPLVDVVAHPWWWMGHWQDDDGCYRGEPWFDDFGHIPRAMHEEFAAALVEHDTLAEANISANLLNDTYPERFGLQYVEYLALLKSAGVRLSLGSDCHSAHYDIDFERAGRMLAASGLAGQDFEQPRLA